jgi:uncharacterized protein (TIGR04255 family)
MNDFVRPHYQRAPIAEALIDIRFANPDSVSIEALTQVANALSDELPTRMAMQHFEVGFQADLTTPNHAQFTNAQQQVGWRLLSREQDRVLQLQKVGFTYSHLPPYTNWETFRSEARLCWSRLKKIMPSQDTTRFAVRVINKIPVPIAGFDPKEYLTIYPVVPEKGPLSVDAMFVQLQYSLSHVLPEARAIINVASGLVEASGSHLVLDIDLFADRIESTEEELWSAIDRFGLEKDVIFESCITDEVRKVIQ